MNKIMSSMLSFIRLSIVDENTQTFSKRDEAKSLVKKALAYVQNNGREKAFAEFDDPKGQFVQGDLYVFVFDLKGTLLAHGSNKGLIGKDMMETQDAEGVYFVKKFMAVAKKEGSGWVDYKWNHPATRAIEPKTSYIEAGGDLIIGCGVYK